MFPGLAVGLRGISRDVGSMRGLVGTRGRVQFNGSPFSRVPFLSISIFSNDQSFEFEEIQDVQNKSIAFSFPNNHFPSPTLLKNEEIFREIKFSTKPEGSSSSVLGVLSSS